MSTSIRSTSSTPLLLSFASPDVRAQASAPRRGKRRHELELSLRLETRLDAELSIAPTRALVDRLGVLLGGQDVVTGDAVFDNAFRIQVRPERVEVLRDALDFGARALIMGARERGASIALDDLGLRATFDPGAPPEALPSTVEPLVEVLRRLERSMRVEGRVRGPYRG